jgi:lysozyme family protein
MQHPYAQTASIFAGYWLNAKVKPERQNEAMVTGARLLKDLTAYQQLETETRVKALFSMCTNERESGGRLNTYLGNGDPLHSVTRDVPRGRGPFPDWPTGAKDALHLDGIDQVTDWTWSRWLFEEVTFNGWGYGTASPYILGGTDLQRPGKYTSDNHYDPNAWDTQLGCVAIAWGILQHMPSLALTADDGTPPDAHLAPSASPITVGGSQHDTKWLQAALNEAAKRSSPMAAGVAAAGDDPQLGVDGNYGRQTRTFVRAFEQAQGLALDRGFAGPQVIGELDKVLGTGWSPPQ